MLGLRHRAGFWGERWNPAAQLLLWSRLKRDKWLSHEDPFLEGSRISSGEGSRLLCLSSASLGEVGPPWQGDKWAVEEVPGMEALLCVYLGWSAREWEHDLGEHLVWEV